MTNIARKFERFVEAYRRPDGGKWGGQDLENATGGVVRRSYVTNLRKGRIENPGYEKLAAIAKAMGFPPSLWFEDVDTEIQPEATDRSLSLSERVNELFKTMIDEKTGKLYTNAEVARMSLGELTEEDVEGIRNGSNPNPSVDQVLSLAEVFGVPASYFLERERKPPIISPSMIEASKDETVTTILNKSLRLPEREKQMVLNIIEQFERMHETDEHDATS